MDETILSCSNLWLASQQKPLKIIYSKLFMVSKQKDELVSNILMENKNVCMESKDIIEVEKGDEYGSG